MENLKEIYLKKCADYACQPVQAFLDDLSSAQGACLTKLTLNGNSKRLFNSRIQPMQVYALCEALHDDANIVSLDLSYNAVDDSAAQAIAGLLKVNKTIRLLDLGGNDIGPVGVGHLADALSSPGAALQALVLRSNALEDAGVSRLGDMLCRNTSLHMLDMFDTKAGIKGIISVCVALSGRNSSLEVLDMGKPTIHGPQDTTILNICQMLACNSTLKDLGLAKHNMVDSQLETLVTYGLLRNQSLTRLDLRANRISAFSGPQLERLLNDNHQLASIDLSHNKLQNDGALSIARSLPYTHWLQQLDLRGNTIGEQGLVALAEGLSLAANLQELLLWGNKFGPAASRAFLDTLGQANLSRLVTDIKPYEVDGVAQVAAMETH